MKTVVLDDDPTGTQSATGVRVLLRWDRQALTCALTEADSVYVQTNSRAVDPRAAVAQVRQVRDDAVAAADRLGEPVRFVLRGDSTLRGHVTPRARLRRNRGVPAADVVVTKGGITSAEVACTAIGATSAWVEGQVLPGVSVWRLTSDRGKDLLYVVVPGNVGDEATLLTILRSIQ